MAKNHSNLSRGIDQAARLIREAEYTVVLTGAGISTPSGIPDFRSAGSGLWTRYDPMEVASLTAFRHHPEKFFDWFRSLALDMTEARPNPAHIALAELEQAGAIQIIITQNIDRLHQRAGSKHVLEVHGSMSTLTCTGCYEQYDSDQFIGPYLETGAMPRCLNCGHVLKPDVVLYEEQLPFRTWMQAQSETRECDLMLVCGSSLEVTPVASLPYQAVEKGAHLIIVNNTPTYVDQRADVVLREDIAEVVPGIATEVIRE
jgi:NAD-dependent deacetylase